MKILDLQAEGFRSLRAINWSPGSLNVIIGPNGTGKSNLLRLLEMISISAQGRLGKHIQSSGGMEPLVWDGTARGISFKLKTTPLDANRPIDVDSLTYTVEIDRVGQSSTYRVADELLGNYFRVDRGEKPGPFKLLERHSLFARIFDAEQRALTAPEESVPEEETLLSLAAGPFVYNRLIPQYQGELAAWSIYHDFHVNQDAPVRSPVVAKHEKRVAPDGQNLITVLHTLYTGDRDFKNEVNLAMRAAFGDEFDELVFPPAADQRIQLRVRWRSLRREQSASDLSDGTLRFLFLLAVLASPSAAPLIAIDEPETGLHPSMLPIIAEYAIEASRRSQVILTTHSPALLDAFSTTVPTTTVALWERGETHLKTIRGDVLSYWLKNYSLGKLLTSGELEQMAREDA